MMNKVIWIDSLNKLSIISDPIKLEIFNHLRTDAYSAKKLSYKMTGLSSQSIHYHLHLLLEHGFIYKKYEERKRSIFETFYHAIAPIIRIDQKLFNNLESNEYQAFINIDNMEEEISKKLNENHRVLINCQKNIQEKSKQKTSEYKFIIDEK